MQHHKNLEDRAPAPRGRRRAEKLVDAPEMSDRPHVPAIFAEHQAPSRRSHSDQPVLGRWKRDRHRGTLATPSCENTHEAHGAGSHGFAGEWIIIFESKQLAPLAVCALRLSGKRPKQRRAKRLALSRVSHDERPRRANAHDIESTK